MQKQCVCFHGGGLLLNVLHIQSQMTKENAPEGHHGQCIPCCVTYVCVCVRPKEHKSVAETSAFSAFTSISWKITSSYSTNLQEENAFGDVTASLV